MKRLLVFSLCFVGACAQETATEGLETPEDVARLLFGAVADADDAPLQPALMTREDWEWLVEVLRDEYPETAARFDLDASFDPAKAAETTQKNTAAILRAVRQQFQREFGSTGAYWAGFESVKIEDRLLDAAVFLRTEKGTAAVKFHCVRAPRGWLLMNAPRYTGAMTPDRWRQRNASRGGG